MNKNEVRITTANIAVREALPDKEGNPSDSRTIEGYAIRFGEESVLMDDWGKEFVEIIAPSCVTEEYLRECDIKMTLFHNREKLLARWNKGEGSLNLAVDEQGVKFSFEAPDNELGDFALEGVKRGDLSGCSFTFAPQDYDTQEKEDGTLLITHTKFAWLGELTIGSDPAYKTTTVNVRELSEGLPSHINERKVEREKLILANEKRMNKLFL